MVTGSPPPQDQHTDTNSSYVCEEYQYSSFNMASLSHWVFLVALLFCYAQAGEARHIPTPEKLCGLIVDQQVKQKCLKCFAEAGELAKNPEGVRKCVGLHLPPIAAECSVPHVEKPAGSRMHQGKPTVHHNHTNANVLPNCLARRMRQLSRYLAKEMKFAKQAGNILKQVVVRGWVDHGGPTMLSAGAMAAILALPEVKSLTVGNAACKECLARYSDTSRHLEHLLQDNEEEWINDIEMVNVEEEIEMRKNSLSVERAVGNAQPFGGTNQLARASLLGSCIITALVDGGQAVDLLNIVGKDTFFFPIPQWWVGPLLRVAKNLNIHWE